MTVPGVPDFYQGNETWDFSLVDPDNRRPVDFELRKRMLESIQGKVDPADLLANWTDGRIKMFVTQRLLQARKEQRSLFDHGAYLPLTARGQHAQSCISFYRSEGRSRMLVIVPRLSSRVGFPPIGPLWSDTEVDSPGTLRNVFTGETVCGPTLRLVDALREFPVGVFVTD
jgi:(1->4)-alpha-D-glucan 1-alpha-D-glucosylmutase